MPLLIDIAVALYSTKNRHFAKHGFWGTLHEARTDVSMLLSLIFLLLVGGGAWSLDAWLAEDGTQFMAEGPALQAPDVISEKRQVPFGELALFFLRLGTTAFGGPAAHIASIMEDELVRRRTVAFS